LNGRMGTIQVTTIVLAAVASGVLTRVLVPLLRRRSVVDTPNERTSHLVPTPRGGGLAVSLVILAAFAFPGGAGGGLAVPPLVYGAFGLLAMLGWLDDLYSVSVRIRLLGHALAVAAALFGLGALPVDLPAGAVSWLAWGVLFLGWIWFINLYNFMDGIDGITAVETLSICLGAVLVLLVADAGREPLFPLFVVAAAVAGFLVWNWHPAKIFLGDVGSVPLGFIVAWFLLSLIAHGAWAAALILPSYYAVDATLTLARRGLRGDKVWQPHREHFYQRAHQRGLSHAQVSSRILAANLCLIGLAVLSVRGYEGPALIGAAVVVAALLIHLQGRAGPTRA